MHQEGIHTIETTPDPTKIEHLGYSHFLDEGGGEYGSFEVFWADAFDVSQWNEHDESVGNEDNCYVEGWYWWACFAGCLPDSEIPSGPFTTSTEAWKDAREEE